MLRVRLASGRVLHCKVEFRCGDSTLMAALQGGTWRSEIGRNLVFVRIK